MKPSNFRFESIKDVQRINFALSTLEIKKELEE